MSESVTTRELIERLVRESGMKKKLATEILHAIPEVIEEGLIRDGEVRVKGLGTFRMKWTQGRTGRNPVTGEDIDIPAHHRLIFLPEQSLKDFINRENEMLGYTVIEEEEVDSRQHVLNPAEPDEGSLVDSRKSIVVSQEEEEEDSRRSAVGGRQEEEDLEEEMDYHYVPEPPARRRRIHWIIPVSVIVIAILSVLFYFRNFYQPVEKSAVGSQQEDNSVPSSRFQVPGEDTVPSSRFQVPGEDTVPSSKFQVPGEDTVQSSKFKVQSEEKVKTQNSETHPAVAGQDSRFKTIEQGKHLFQLAREEYGNPFLWVLIYKENQDILTGPDQAIIGKTVKIPVLEGSPHNLSRNDSTNVAEGYRLVYEYYKAKGTPEADDFYTAWQNYLPK